MSANLRAAAVFLAGAGLCSAARLTPAAEQAFQTYVAGVEKRLAAQHARPETYLTGMVRERDATVHVEAIHGGTWEVSGGLLHHWRASAFVPGATASELLSILRSYDHLPRYYSPDVVSSRALHVEGDQATVLTRFRKQKIITVVLDVEFDTRYALDGPGRGSGYSRSTHVWQVDQPGTAKEHRKPEGNDDGYLWRLNSYWSFAETHGGLLMECEAVSLTRDVPTGLGWLISPIVQSLPRASLEFTMTATRNALAANHQEARR